VSVKVTVTGHHLGFFTSGWLGVISLPLKITPHTKTRLCDRIKVRIINCSPHRRMILLSAQNFTLVSLSTDEINQFTITIWDDKRMFVTTELRPCTGVHEQSDRYFSQHRLSAVIATRHLSAQQVAATKVTALSTVQYAGYAFSQCSRTAATGSDARTKGQ